MESESKHDSKKGQMEPEKTKCSCCAQMQCAWDWGVSGWHGGPWMSKSNLCLYLMIIETLKKCQWPVMAS